MSRLVACATLVVLCSITATRAHQPAAPPNLPSAIDQVKTGDLIGALVTLNGVVDQLSGSVDQSATLARARAYQTLTYSLLGQPERARSSAVLALTADPAIVINAAEFPPAVVALFDEVRRPAPTNLDHEAVADAADRAGGVQEAFLSYLRAFQALPDPPAPADDQRLREKIMRVVQKLETPPPIPPAAAEHAAKGDALLQAETILGGTAGASSQAAAAEFRRALRVAPWWPEATFKLASVLQKLQRVDEALVNLNLYKLADPKGFAASAERAKPATVAAPARPSAAAGPAAAVADAKTEVVPAVVHVYRPGKFTGSGTRAGVHCNGQKMADLQNDRVVSFKAAPGKYALKVGNKEFPLEVYSGGEYYFRTSAGMLGWSVEPASVEAAKAEIKEKTIRSGDVNRIHSTECK